MKAIVSLFPIIEGREFHPTLRSCSNFIRQTQFAISTSGIQGNSVKTLHNNSPVASLCFMDGRAQ